MKKIFSGIFVAFLLFAGCSTLPRFKNPESDILSFMNSDTSYGEYTERCREIIGKNRVDLNEFNRQKVIDANSPFELYPDEKKFPRGDDGRYENGILLIHGLSNSPYETRSIARYFQSRGFIVRSILLPGHGTVPGDLLGVSYQDWIDACHYGTATFKNEVEHLYVGGNSLGATLAVYIGLTGTDIDGLFLFAPALEVSSAAWLTTTFIVPAWLSKALDLDYARYESFSSNASAQTYLLIKEVDRALENGKRLEMPVFAAFSETDMTVMSDRSVQVFNNYVVSDKSRMLIYTPHPEKYGNSEDMRVIPVSSAVPEEKVIDYSHLSIIVEPEDAHYGRDGDYKLCYFYSDRDKIVECLNSPNVYQGEYTKEYLKEYTLKRLTYNPKFHAMTERIDRFLADGK